MKRFLSCLREFAVAREGGRYTPAETKKKIEQFKKLTEMVDEELQDMQGYLDKALAKLKAVFQGGKFIGTRIAVRRWIQRPKQLYVLFDGMLLCFTKRCNRHDFGDLELGGNVPRYAEGSNG